MTADPDTFGPTCVLCGRTGKRGFVRVPDVDGPVCSSITACTMRQAAQRTDGLTRRTNHGQSHGYKLDGRKVTGATTLISAGLPKPALVQWAANEVAKLAAEKRKVLPDLEPEEIYDLLRMAHRRTNTKAATRGTTIHRWAERLQAGETFTVGDGPGELPEEIADVVESCAAFLDEHRVEPVLTEFTVGSRKHRYMGTGDLVADTSTMGRALLDYKTSKNIYGDTALQLAAYRYAEFYLDELDEEQPMLEVERCGIVWLRSDGYDVAPVEAGPRQFRQFLYVVQIAQFVDEAPSLIGDLLPHPKVETP